MRIPARPHRRRLRTTLAGSAALLAIAAGATACGSDSDDSDGDDARNESTSDTGGGSDATGLLSAEQVEEATLSIENLGGDWEEEAAKEEDDDAPGFGCFGEIDALVDDDHRLEKTEKQFAHGTQGIPQVNSSVSSYAESYDIAAVFDEVERAMEACTAIEAEENGFTYDLDVRPLSDLALDDIDIDDQFSFEASGSFAKDGQSTEFYLYGTWIRVGHSVASIGTTTLEGAADQHATYATIGATRLAAVAAGETPEQTVAPAP